jgi:hypothetical protein
VLNFIAWPRLPDFATGTAGVQPKSEY